MSTRNSPNLVIDAKIVLVNVAILDQELITYRYSSCSCCRGDISAE